MAKMTWRKSDLWPVTVVFLAITVCSMLYDVLWIIDGFKDEHIPFIWTIPLTFALVSGFTDRSEALRREEADPEARKALEDRYRPYSGINADNTDRGKDPNEIG